MLLYLAFKNIISKKSSFVIILFIAFAIMILVVTNSVFDSTEQGIQETFVSSFTGDIVVRPRNKYPLSLFGDETPVTGKLSELPNLVPFGELSGFLGTVPEISHVVPQVSGQAVLSSDSEDSAAFMFGVQPDKYLSCMDSIRIAEGSAWENGEKGLMLSRRYAEKMNVSVGDTLQFMINEGFSSRIRAVPLTAVYEYPVENTVLDKIVLVNPETVRAIMDMSELSSAENVVLSDEQESMLDAAGMDIDALFEDASDFSDVIRTEEPDFSDEDVRAAMQDSYSDSSSWNFIVCRLKNSKEAKSLIKRLNRTFETNDWPVEAVNWRSSAGSTAFYLYVLRLILNTGIIIVLGAGFIVVNNTLVINVLDRLREIGTMRAIGAGKRYISAECMAETFIMSAAAGVIGCIFGIVASRLVTAADITFSNSFLIQLFGSSSLRTSVTPGNLIASFSLSLLIGLVAWIYPVVNALRINPVKAMQGAK